MQSRSLEWYQNFLYSLEADTEQQVELWKYLELHMEM